MIRRPPRSTRTDTLFPYTTLFRSHDFTVSECPCRAVISLPATASQSFMVPSSLPDNNFAPLLANTQVLTRWRSEEHTSELQSLMRISYAVFCLKKKQ